MLGVGLAAVLRQLVWAPVVNCTTCTLRTIAGTTEMTQPAMDATTASPANFQQMFGHWNLLICRKSHVLFRGHCSPENMCLVIYPTGLMGAKLRYAGVMVLIVSGISMKDRSGKMTSICYAKEHSCLPCSILQSPTACWVKRPSFHYFGKYPQITQLFASSARCSCDVQDLPERPLRFKYLQVRCGSLYLA